MEKFIIDVNTPVIFGENESGAVCRAFEDFQNDWYMVFGMQPHIFSSLPEGYKKNAIFIGREAQKHSKSEECTGRECFVVETEGNILCMKGSDELGLIYAMYSFSEELLGVSPWYYWNDFLPEKKEKIELSQGIILKGEEPDFKYRGFFLNNEDMLTGFFRDPLDENILSPYHIDKICELILRLHGNTFAPGTRVYPDETGRDVISNRGIYVNDHHVTPLGLNVYAWPKELPFSYVTHPEILEEMWEKCIDAQKHRKNLWTVSFRGKGDGPFWDVDPAAPESDGERGEIISRAIKKQVELIKRVQPEADIIFNMYDEQAELYKQGFLKIPDGVIKVWPNDGAGLMSDDGRAEKGDGAYFHITACRNRVTEAVSPETCYSELGRLRRCGADGCVIINIGNIRIFPVSISAVMNFAYESDRYLQKEPSQQMDDTILEYAQKHYDGYAKEVADIYCKLFRCSNFRRPEKGKAPFGYGAQCLGLYAGMWDADNNQVLPEFRQNLYMHELARKYIRVLKGEEEFSEIWVKTVDDFNSVLDEDTAYLPELAEKANELYDKIPERSRLLYLQNVLVPINAINYLNCAMKYEGLSVKAYFAGDNETAISEMEKALSNMKKMYDTLHRGESAKWYVWYKNECLACYPHTHDLIACTLSLLKGEGELLIRPFVDFAGHNKHVSLYQHKRGNKNFPYLNQK